MQAKSQTPSDDPTDKEFEVGARAIATANRISIETARTYFSFVGYTPEIDKSGLAIVRDNSGREIARVSVPTSES